MDRPELLRILACGEDSRHQFKQTVNQPDALAAELIAFSNSVGGQLFIGVDDQGQVTGLPPDEIRRINQLLSNTASNNVRPPVNPITSNIQTGNGIVMVVEVEEGSNKPYVDIQGRIWVKSGADKRHVTAREELRRMFQTADLVYADEVPAHPATVDDIDEREFVRYFERRYRKQVDSMGMDLAQLLQNLNLARNNVPTLSGLLLFGKAPQVFKPAFVIKAVAFPGKILHDNHYLDSEDIDGTLPAASPSSSAICVIFRGSKASIVPACSKCRKKYLKNCWSMRWCIATTF